MPREIPNLIDSDGNQAPKYITEHIKLVMNNGDWKIVFDSKASEFKDPSPIPWALLWLVLSAIVLSGYFCILSLIPS